MLNNLLTPTKPTKALADLLSTVLACSTREVCISFLTSSTNGKDNVTSKQRKSLSKLAGLGASWVNCDQDVTGNKEDLAALICDELYDPYVFYTQTLEQHDHSDYFEALSSKKKYSWLPASSCTFDATLHFIQGGSGTGVHIGDGLILSCAHVVACQGDAEGVIPDRVGRIKTVMFPNGLVFLAKCVAVTESSDGMSDTAALRLIAVVNTLSLENLQSLPCAHLASTPPSVNTNVLCIGNPSSIDLESRVRKKINFSPATWHSSVGRIVSVMPHKLVTHSCWTYWGHSGAPLFDESGDVVGLHCAWDDHTGARLCQRLETLVETVLKAGEKKRKNHRKEALCKRIKIDVIDLT